VEIGGETKMDRSFKMVVAANAKVRQYVRKGLAGPAF